LFCEIGHYNSDQENNVVELLVYTVFGNEAATELTLPGLKKPFFPQLKPSHTVALLDSCNANV